MNHCLVELDKTEFSYQEGMICQCVNCGIYISVRTAVRILNNLDRFSMECPPNNYKKETS